MKRLRVAGFGDSIIDIFPQRGEEHLGGNSLNVAVFARRKGADAAYVGVVGNDERGRRILGALIVEGVGIAYVRVVPGETGWVLVELTDGDRAFVRGNRGGVTRSSPFRVDDMARRALAEFDLVHSSVYSASESELPRLDRTRSVVSFDFSSGAEHRDPDYLALVCPHVDIAQFSCADLDESEIRGLLDAAIAAGAGSAVATRGEGGALALFGGAMIAAPAVRIPEDRIVDTTGCGDAFFATFALNVLAAGHPTRHPPEPDAVRLALDRAVHDAAVQATVTGALGHRWPWAGDIVRA